MRLTNYDGCRVRWSETKELPRRGFISVPAAFWKGEGLRARIPLEQKVTWTRAGENWHATTQDGKDAGMWSSRNLVVTQGVDSEKPSTTDLSKHVSATLGGGSKQVSVNGVPITVPQTGSTIVFSQPAKGGLVEKSIVITYGMP